MKRLAIIVAVATSITGTAIGENNVVRIEREGQTLLSLSFEGGTLAEYYELLDQHHSEGQSAFTPEVGNLQMPRLGLQEVLPYTLYTAPGKLIPGVEVELETGGAELPVFFVRASAEALAQAQGFDLDFPGGEMEEFVGALRDVAGANVLLRPEAAGVQVPRISLRDANLHNVMMTMYGRLRAPEGGRLDIVWMATDDAANPLYIIGIEDAADPVVPLKPRVEHWSLGSIVEQTPVTARDVLGAIEVAQEFFEDEVLVRYHEPTRTLIARGLETDLEVIDGLIDRVERSADFMEQDK